MPVKDTNPLTAKHFLGLVAVCITIVASMTGLGWKMANVIRDESDKNVKAFQEVTKTVIKVEGKVDSLDEKVEEIDETVDSLEARSRAYQIKQAEQSVDLEYIKDRIEDRNP